MSLRRCASIVWITLFAAGAVVAAAPAKPAKQKPAAKQRAKQPATKPGANTGSGSAADSNAATGSAATGANAAAGSAAAGSAAPPPEPPPDMQGTAETPDDPKAVGMEAPPAVVVAKPTEPTGYPTEEALRPITLPANMLEISIAPHLQVSPVAGSDALRARYGITSDVQIGLTYLYAGLYDRQSLNPGVSSQYGLHGGKAFGIDATVRLQDWIAVKVGIPMYVNPLAVALALGVPIKFTFSNKFAIGGLDDLLNIKLYRFAPTFYQEVANAVAAQGVGNNTQQSRGNLRFSAFGIYQQSPELAFIGRIGIDNDLGLTSDGPAGTSSGGGTVTFARIGLQYAVRRYFDVGGSVGWDSLATMGTFGPQLFFALRI